MSGRRRRSTSTSARPSFGRRASPISRAAGRSNERSAGSSAPDIRTASGRAIRDALGALSDGPGDGHLQPVADDPRGLRRVRYLRGPRDPRQAPCQRNGRRVHQRGRRVRRRDRDRAAVARLGWLRRADHHRSAALFRGSAPARPRGGRPDRWTRDAPAWRLCRRRRRRRRGPAARDLPRGARARGADRPDPGPSRQRDAARWSTCPTPSSAIGPTRTIRSRPPRHRRAAHPHRCAAR